MRGLCFIVAKLVILTPVERFDQLSLAILWPASEPSCDLLLIGLKSLHVD
jgi:hypothetical protein